MKRGELTPAHRAQVGEQRGKGSAQPARRGEQRFLGRLRDPHSLWPGPAEARPRDRAPPSGAAPNTNPHTHPGCGGEKAAPAQAGSREHPGETQPLPGGRAAGGGAERERRGRGLRARGGTLQGNCAQLLCWPLPASAAQDPERSPLIWRPFMPCRSSPGLPY